MVNAAPAPHHPDAASPEAGPGQLAPVLDINEYRYRGESTMLATTWQQLSTAVFNFAPYTLDLTSAQGLAEVIFLNPNAPDLTIAGSLNRAEVANALGLSHPCSASALLEGLMALAPESVAILVTDYTVRRGQEKGRHGFQLFPRPARVLSFIGARNARAEAARMLQYASIIDQARGRADQHTWESAVVQAAKLRRRGKTVLRRVL